MPDIFIKPAKAGLIVRDPINLKPLEAEGEFKPRDTYWIRRKKDGDVIEADAPQPAVEEKG